MSKRKSTAPAEEIGPLTAEPPKAIAESTTPVGMDGNLPTRRELGDDTATEQAAGQKKSSWAPRTTIAVPLTEEAKRDHTKGEVARYIDGYSRGVGARIDSPDPEFRPSGNVTEPLKAEHPNRESMRWNKEVFADKDVFHKKVAGHGRSGRALNPVAERLDGEERFEEMVQRRREDIEKPDGGKSPF